MSKRLQVLLDDAEYRDLQRTAKRQGFTVSQWVRRAIDSMRRREPLHDSGRKLAVVREAARFTYPAGDIGSMLAEIERGYGVGMPGEPSA